MVVQPPSTPFLHMATVPTVQVPLITLTVLIVSAIASTVLHHYFIETLLIGVQGIKESKSFDMSSSPCPNALETSSPATKIPALASGGSNQAILAGYPLPSLSTPPLPLTPSRDKRKM